MHATTPQEQAAMDYFNKLVRLTPGETEAFRAALIGVAYWLDCSVHERDEASALAMARFIRMIAPRLETPID